jgi:hypothetical protein
VVTKKILRTAKKRAGCGFAVLLCANDTTNCSTRAERAVCGFFCWRIVVAKKILRTAVCAQKGRFAVFLLENCGCKKDTTHRSMRAERAARGRDFTNSSKSYRLGKSYRNKHTGVRARERVEREREIVCETSARMMSESATGLRYRLTVNVCA